MMGHSFEIFFELLKIVGGVQNKAKIFEVLVEGMRYSLAKIDTANSFNMYFFHLLIKALDSVLDELKLSLFVFTDKKFIKFKIMVVPVA